jgi:hypothetical protein
MGSGKEAEGPEEVKLSRPDFLPGFLLIFFHREFLLSVSEAIVGYFTWNPCVQPTIFWWSGGRVQIGIPDPGENFPGRVRGGNRKFISGLQLDLKNFRIVISRI